MHFMRPIMISGSDVVHVDVLGTHMVIVNSSKAAKELFDRRSLLYSDRYFKIRAAANCLVISDGSQASFGSVEPHVSPLSAYVYLRALQPTLSNDSLGMDWASGFIPYGARWRILRRGFHEHFNPAASKAYHPLQQRAVHRLLRNLLQSPEHFSQHLRQ
jgi:hypothetical protein